MTDRGGRCRECGAGERRPGRFADVYTSHEWRHRVRPAIMKRDKEMCTRCGFTGEAFDANGERINWLEVDHRVPLTEGGDPFDHANLRVLCRTCNLDRRGKGSDG